MVKIPQLEPNLDRASTVFFRHQHSTFSQWLCGLNENHMAAILECKSIFGRMEPRTSHVSIAQQAWRNETELARWRVLRHRDGGAVSHNARSIVLHRLNISRTSCASWLSIQHRTGNYAPELNRLAVGGSGAEVRSASKRAQMPARATRKGIWGQIPGDSTR